MNDTSADDEVLLDESESKVRMLLADDHPMLREGIRHLLEREPDFEVVGEACDGNEAIRLADNLEPDVVVMDIHMPKVSGLEATRQIKEKHPTIAVLVLTIHDEDEYVMGLLQAGAAGYLLKTAYGEQLVQAIRSVVSGEFVLHPAIARRLLKSTVSSELPSTKIDEGEQVTAREMQVLKLAARGMANNDIAGELEIGIRTVKGHLVNIFDKMRVGSRTEAVLVALKKGWVSLDEEDIDQGNG